MNGPPVIVPSALTLRYLCPRKTSAHLSAMPKNPKTIIQKTAPGPPFETATATPTMEPVPIVAAIEDISALNGVISSLDCFPLNFPRRISNACFTPKMFMNLRRIVKKTLTAPSHKITNGTPKILKKSRCSMN